ncbi:MAG: hypothetical protein QW117_01065 [Candidatus Pacearchaeota archaeon]
MAQTLVIKNFLFLDPFNKDGLFLIIYKDTEKEQIYNKHSIIKIIKYSKEIDEKFIIDDIEDFGSSVLINKKERMIVELINREEEIITKNYLKKFDLEKIR